MNVICLVVLVCQVILFYNVKYEDKKKDKKKKKKKKT